MEAGGITIERHGDRWLVRVTGRLTVAMVNDLRAMTLRARHTDLDATAAHVAPEAAELLRAWQAQDHHHFSLHLPVAPDVGEDAEGVAPPVDVPDLLAHELRTPLALAHLRLQALAGRMDHEGRGHDATECRQILGSLQQLAGVLDMYLTANGPWTFSPLDLRTLCLELGGAPAEQLGLGTVRPLPGSEAAWVRGEPRALRQALWNLVRNGLEAGAPNGAVTISVRVLAGRGIAEVLVRDSGAGFPAHMLATPLTHHASHKPQGMGIGLAICRWILHRHGGALQLRNQAGGGEARVILPLAQRTRL